MDVVNITNEERILINKAKVNYLLENPAIKSVSNGSLILYILKKYNKVIK